MKNTLLFLIGVAFLVWLAACGPKAHVEPSTAQWRLSADGSHYYEDGPEGVIHVIMIQGASAEEASKRCKDLNREPCALERIGSYYVLEPIKTKSGAAAQKER